MATNDIPLKVSDNTERVSLRVSDGRSVRSITPDSGSPYYVGARAYVTQTENGAVVTVIDKDGTTTATIMNGADGAAGQDGADGADGYSPTATVSKVGDTATITITDKDGTTTASISDGSGSAMAFVAAYGVDTYADVKDAYDDGVMILCSIDDSGNILLLQLAYFDDANDVFYFAVPMSDGGCYTQLSNADGWDDGMWYFASTDTATTLADGLMSALDKQKLDTIASGAEVNVQSDWSQADNTKDDYIKNKPAIPTITDTYSGTSSDGMSGKAVKSAIDALDGTISGSAGSGKTLTAFSQTDGKVSATFGNISITKSQVSDFPSLASVATSGSYSDLSGTPTIPTDTGDLTNGAGFITGYTETDPVFTASDAYGISSTDITNWNGKLDKTGILNLFYPVGSYYETSDTSFDPSVSWGGTWVLETEGQVHISGSAGGTYQVGGALTNTTDGGAATVTLTTNEMPKHSHTVNYVNYSRGSGSSAAMGYLTQNPQTNHALSEETGGGGAHENMPPYIVVYRWHRTA